MDWDCVSLASLQLTDTEHRYYGDIYIYCCENAQAESGVPMAKVVELLNSANLPRQVMLKVCHNNYDMPMICRFNFG